MIGLERERERESREYGYGVQLREISPLRVREREMR